MKLLGLPDMIRAVADAYTAWKKGKGPAAAEDFEKEADRAQKSAAAREVRAFDRAVRRRAVLGVRPGGKRKPPAKPAKPSKPRPVG